MVVNILRTVPTLPNVVWRHGNTHDANRVKVPRVETKGILSVFVVVKKKLESRTTKYRGGVCAQDLKWDEDSFLTVYVVTAWHWSDSMQFPNHYRLMNKLPRELIPKKIGETRYGSRVTNSQCDFCYVFYVSKHIVCVTVTLSLSIHISQ